MVSKKSSVAAFARGGRALMPIMLALAMVFSPVAARADGPKPGQGAPDIALVDLNGKPLKLSELEGKVVLIDFWASWCAPCKEELPVLEKLHKAYAADGLVIVGVNIDKDAGIAREFLTKNKLALSFPIVNDKSHDVAKRYAPPTMPSSYLVDRSGKIRYVHAGFRASDEEKLKTEIKAMLGR